MPPYDNPLFALHYAQIFGSIRISQRLSLRIHRAFAPPCRTFRFTRTDYDPPSPFRLRRDRGEISQGFGVIH